jgi:hypothetical protein
VICIQWCGSNRADEVRRARSPVIPAPRRHGGSRPR